MLCPDLPVISPVVEDFICRAGFFSIVGLNERENEWLERERERKREKSLTL
jgi:hypothetical protein